MDSWNESTIGLLLGIRHRNWFLHPWNLFSHFYGPMEKGFPFATGASLCHYFINRDFIGSTVKTINNNLIIYFVQDFDQRNKYHDYDTVVMFIGTMTSSCHRFLTYDSPRIFATLSDYMAL